MRTEITRVFSHNDGDTNGYVDVHSGHNGNERSLNVATSMVLAKCGYEVLLLPVDDSPGTKNPDILLVQEKLFVEIKHNLSPTASAIDHAIRSGRHQADCILLHIMSKIAKGELINAAKGRIKRCDNVNSLWLIIGPDTLYQFTRDEVLNGTMDDKIQ